MQSNIELLEELTKNLPILDPLMFAGISNSTVSYAVECGEGTAKNLMNIDGIAVANCIFSPDTVLPRHNHEEKEWFLVYSGTLDVAIDGLATEDIGRLMGNGSNFMLKAGDFIFVPPRIPHVVSSTNGAKFIAITIPSSPAFPGDDARE